MSPLPFPLRIAFSLYQYFLSPIFHLLMGPGYGCRFVPTCSEYCRTACVQHGTLKGLALGGFRILRCNPFSIGGFDPVPHATSINSNPMNLGRP